MFSKHTAETTCQLSTVKGCYPKVLDEVFYPLPLFQGRRGGGGASCNVDKFLSLAKVFCMGVARKGDHLAWLLFKFLPYAK